MHIMKQISKVLIILELKKNSINIKTLCNVPHKIRCILVLQYNKLEKK